MVSGTVSGSTDFFGLDGQPHHCLGSGGDLGGAGYLFVRGMVGSQTPLSNGTRNGVLAWRPSVESILKVNALLGGDVK